MLRDDEKALLVVRTGRTGEWRGLPGRGQTGRTESLVTGLDRLSVFVVTFNRYSVLETSELPGCY